MYSKKDKMIQGYTITEHKIGQGAFGAVFLGFDEDGQQLAVKVISRDQVTGRISGYLHNEILALKTCKNEHIVSFIDIKKTTSHYYVFIEYCEGGDLAQYIKTNGRLPEEEALEMFYQIVRGFRTIVKKSLVHRDLKPANIFLKGGKIKIGDFGLAKLLNPDAMARTFAGSPYNMAPEVLSHKEYDNKADIYSIGTVLYEMLFGNPPFVSFNHMDLLQEIKGRRYHNFDAKLVSKETGTLLARLLKVEPGERMDWEELFNYESKRKQKQNVKTYNKYKEFLSKINFSKFSAIPGIFCLLNGDSLQSEGEECTDAKFLDLNLSSRLFVNLIKSTSIEE